MSDPIKVRKPSTRGQRIAAYAILIFIGVVVAALLAPFIVRLWMWGFAG